MSSRALQEDILKNFGGVSVNCRNDLLNNPEDLDNSITITADSPYIEPKDLIDYLKGIYQVTSDFYSLSNNGLSSHTKYRKVYIFEKLTKCRFRFFV